MKNTTETNDTELRAHIAGHALNRFITDGFTRVRTDDLATDLGISKKTIYRVFADKKDILNEAVGIHTARIENALVESFDDCSGGFPERIGILFGVVQRYIVPIQNVFATDLLRSAPDVWQQIDTFRRERVLSRLEATIRGGVAEGYLRPDIKPDMLVGLLARFVEQVVTPQTIMEMDISFAELFRFIRVMFFEGILTESGRDVWEDSYEQDR